MSGWPRAASSESCSCGPEPCDDCHVPGEKGVLDADRDFFAALIAGDAAALAGMLVDDFVIVDVMSGNEAGRELFAGAVEGNQLSVRGDPPRR